MVGKSKAVGEELALKAESMLQAMGKTGEKARKLQAIIAARNHSISSVAKIFHVTRATLMCWIKKFERDAEAGLGIKGGRGRKPKIPQDIIDDIQKFITNDPNATIMACLFYVKREHGLNVGRMTIYRVLKRLKLSHITPRPRHMKSDPKAQEVFKKKPQEPRAKKST